MEYPEKLDDAIDFALADKNLKAPSKDRWKNPWEYELVGFKHLVKVPKNQKYALGSSLLGKQADFEKALEAPYKANIDIMPVQMGSTTRGSESVFFVNPADRTKTKVLIKVGHRRMGATLGFVGNNIIAVSDGDYWKLLPRPRR